MVDRLADSDITKFDQIYERNYLECLNLLAYWREKDNFVESQNQLLMSQYRKK